MTLELSASLMCADFTRLDQQIAQLKTGGVSRLHLDFADGHFVPNLLLGTEVLGMLGGASGLKIESHLMVQDPARFLHLFIPGSDVVILHVESDVDPTTAIDMIRRAGKTPGLALRPDTPARSLLPYLTKVGHILVMCVQPGFAGGRFIPATVDTVRELRRAADADNPELDIQVDGSINEKTIPMLLEAGANIFVGGSSGLFVGDDLTRSARSMLKIIRVRG
jgi:ribulose-phosphate 3-epimerase